MKENLPVRRIDRRHFLTGAGALLCLSALEACQLGDLLTAFRATGTPVPTFVSTSLAWKTPTTGPSGTAIPTGTGTPSPTATPSSTEQGTETATPSPTGTATPEEGGSPTPTPTPTPYPPGPPSKLGIFTTRADGQINTLIEVGKPALVKTLNLDPNFAKFIKEKSPTTIVVGRIDLPQLDLDADPIPLAQSAAAKLLDVALDSDRLKYFDAWEAHNEPVADTPAKMQNLASFEAERTRLLGEQGVRSVVGNFAAGHPPLELWPQFAPALAAARKYHGYLGLHEYSAPVMQWGFGALQSTPGTDEGDEGWLTIRYRKAYRQQLGPMGYGDIPLLITECGVDGLVKPRPGPEKAGGWQDFELYWHSNGLRADMPGVYMDQLLWYDSELQKDAYVKGAAIFVMGASPGWESYEILGHTADLLTQYLQVHPPKQ